MKIIFWLFSVSCCFALDSVGLVEQLVRGNYKKECELDVLQLFRLEPKFFEELAIEVKEFLSYYPTNSSKLVLFNRTGNVFDRSADHDGSIQNKRFFYGQKYPHLARLISLFPHAINFRMTVMKPGRRLFQHDENICLKHRLTGEPCLRVRFHLPIQTNPKAMMFMDGNLYHFDPGVIYFFHNGRVHDAINGDKNEERIHLIWDMLLTEDTYERMFERSIPMDGLMRLEDMRVTLIGKDEVEPNYLKRERILSEEEAMRATLCPVQ